MVLPATAIDTLSRAMQVASTFGAQLLAFVHSWLLNEAILMPTMYITGVTILLLAVLHAIVPSRRRRARSEELPRQNAIQDEAAQRASPGSPTLVTGTAHTESNHRIDLRFREIEDEVAMVKSNLESIKAASSNPEMRPTALVGITCGSSTEILRKELEALRAAMNGNSEHNERSPQTNSET